MDQTPPPSIPPSSNSTSQQPTYITLENFTSFMDQLLKGISEGFQRTFDSLLSVLLSSIPSQHQAKAREAANQVTKRAFDMRTIFQVVGSKYTVLHSKTKS